MYTSLDHVSRPVGPRAGLPAAQLPTYCCTADLARCIDGRQACNARKGDVKRAYTLGGDRGMAA